MTTISRVNIYRAGPEWCYSAWTASECDHSDTVGLPDDASETEVVEEVQTWWPRATVTRVPDVTAPQAEECECSCGCSEHATTTDDSGIPVCAACADYYTTDNGDVVCSREQDARSCRHCSEDIVWGRIQTGQPGVPNWRDGHCSCRQWTETERGGDQWELSEGEVRQ